ncbi:hypothetical protein R1sor_008343 [Riccia sorocarpa]|uniref:Uncharacterized protein n=1 Tax=Riccia sorocarpa TaxID=122646 RepID=A0ABD3HWM7_9MARC
MANRDLNLPWYTEEYLLDADAQPPFPGSAELDAGPGDQGPDETQNSPARSDADNSPESEEEPVPIPENGLPGWIAVGVQYNPSDLRKYFLCDGKTWDSGKLNIEHHCSHPVLKQNWEEVDAEPQTPTGMENTRKFENVLCSFAAWSSMPTRLDPNLAAKMEKARVKEATRRSLEQDLLTVPGFAVNDHGESSGQRSKGNLDSSCPPRLQQKWRKQLVGVHGWIDEMLRNVMIANQERDQIQSRLKKAEDKCERRSNT